MSNNTTTNEQKRDIEKTLKKIKEYIDSKDYEKEIEINNLITMVEKLKGESDTTPSNIDIDLLSSAFSDMYNLANDIFSLD